MKCEKILKEIARGALVVAVSAALGYAVSRTVACTVVVSGSSMEPSYHDGDVLIVQRLGYHPEHGDVVILRSESRGIMVKRVVGLPGDVLTIENSSVALNGEPLEEPYTAPGIYRGLDSPAHIEDGHVFVLGDNRPYSCDSRSDDMGQIPAEDIMGGVVFRLWDAGEEAVA